MDLDGLRSFVAVAEEMHFGRAAERIHMTQPPLSRQIRRLEDGLGVRLFRRTTRRVEITDAGRTLLGHARSLLAAAGEAVDAVRRADRGEVGRIVVGAVTPAIDGVLPAIVRAFRDRHPGIDVSILELDTSSQLDALRSDRVHVGFVRLADHDMSGLESRSVARERYVVALPRGHRLDTGVAVRLRALAGEPMVGLAPEIQPELHRRVLAACAKAGFEPRIVQTARTIHTLTALVASGMGLALVPESAGEGGRPAVSFAAVRGALPRVEVAAVWRRWNPSPALRHFREVMSALRGRPATS